MFEEDFVSAYELCALDWIFCEHVVNKDLNCDDEKRTSLLFSMPIILMLKHRRKLKLPFGRKGLMRIGLLPWNIIPKVLQGRLCYTWIWKT